MEERFDLLHHRGHAARLEDLVHHVFAGGLDIDDEGRRAADVIEEGEGQINAEPPGVARRDG